MTAGGFCKTRGAYLAVRICCILVNRAGATIMTIGERGERLLSDSSTLGGFNLKGGEFLMGKKFDMRLYRNLQVVQPIFLHL
jgi:hypothetical protein